MTELLDIGNTFTRIARWDGYQIRSLHRVPTADFSGTGSGLPQIAACVCPAVKERLSGSGIRFISAQDNASAVDFSGVDCSTLGADRVANAIALAELYELPGLVVDCGTALTLEIVDSKKRFLGGAIAPGRRLMRQALHCGTAQLPEVAMSDVIPAEAGCNTVDAIRFGIDRGCVGIIKEFIAQTSRIMPVKTVVLTGGDARFFAPEIPGAVVADDTFTLTGIRIAGGC